MHAFTFLLLTATALAAPIQTIAEETKHQRRSPMPALDCDEIADLDERIACTIADTPLLRRDFASDNSMVQRDESTVTGLLESIFESMTDSDNNLLLARDAAPGSICDHPQTIGQALICAGRGQGQGQGQNQQRVKDKRDSGVTDILNSVLAGLKQLDGQVLANRDAPEKRQSTEAETVASICQQPESAELLICSTRKAKRDGNQAISSESELLDANSAGNSKSKRDQPDDGVDCAHPATAYEGLECALSTDNF